MFQLKMDQILEQVDGTVRIADDVAVYAKDDKEHDKVHNLFRVAKENGLVFSSNARSKRTRVQGKGYSESSNLQWIFACLIYIFFYNFLIFYNH